MSVNLSLHQSGRHLIVSSRDGSSYKKKNNFCQDPELSRKDFANLYTFAILLQMYFANVHVEAVAKFETTTDKLAKIAEMRLHPFLSNNLKGFWGLEMYDYSKMR